jgi:hypothetical protein
MATVLEDVERRAKMSAIAVERAASRSWEVAAVTVLDLLEEVAGR